MDIFDHFDFCHSRRTRVEERYFEMFILLGIYNFRRMMENCELNGKKLLVDPKC